MDPLLFAAHLLGFAAPALALAVLVAAAARLLAGGKAAKGPHGDKRAWAGWWRSVAVNALVGVAALAAGLAYFGRDGKMASYALLVLGVASSQWWLSRSWRG